MILLRSNGAEVTVAHIGSSLFFTLIVDAGKLLETNVREDHSE